MGSKLRCAFDFHESKHIGEAYFLGATYSTYNEGKKITISAQSMDIFKCDTCGYTTDHVGDNVIIALEPDEGTKQIIMAYIRRPHLTAHPPTFVVCAVYWDPLLGDYTEDIPSTWDPEYGELVCPTN